jgi:thymidylate kinase
MTGTLTSRAGQVGDVTMARDDDLRLAGESAQLVDGLLPERAIVFGRLPSTGRDLDLLVPDGSLGVIRRGLRAAGLVMHDDTFAAFRHGTAFGVDVIPASRWALPPAEIDALFEGARPLAGFRALARPSPAHALLIAARRGVGGWKPMTGRWHAMVAAAEREDPACWAAAGRSAALWGVDEALDVLGQAYRRRPEEMGASPRHAIRAGIARPRPGAVVALSGLDGSGKSTQAVALRHALGRLGVDAVIVWRPVARIAILGAAARVGRAVLGGTPWDAEASDDRGGPDPVSGRGGGAAGAPRLRAIWSALVTLLSAIDLWWGVAPHLARGQVVICDRYRLDTMMHLRARHGRPSGKGASWQRRLLRVLTPHPRRSFFLDLDPATAFARKVPRYDVPELAKRRAIYLEELGRWGVRRIDGARPPEKVAAEIAAETWTAVMRARRR